MPYIEYFYSAHSAFAYLGSRRLMGIVESEGCSIVHKPFDLNAGIAAAGFTSTRDRSQNYRNYFFRREIDRWSEYRNVPIM
ncbi:MAG: hypothetical protein CMM58_02330 [Rhodospirillaceae bacterium]|nr:hypothetical protein [Rhodospirillaceae bacterium]